jgi:hypothetical protein
MQIIERLSVGKNGIRVDSDVFKVGNDWLIVVSGGDKPHIGAISFGNKEEENNIALLTHKELAVTQLIYQKLIDLCPENLLVTGGIHIDYISKQQILLVLELCEELSGQLKQIITPRAYQ